MATTIDPVNLTCDGCGAEPGEPCIPLMPCAEAAAEHDTHRPVEVRLLSVVAYERPTDPTTVRPIPDGYDLSRLTIVPARDVRAGDLVVGSVDQPVHGTRSLRWATYRYAPFVAEPGPDLADCAYCRSFMGSGDGPSVTLTPHNPERADALIAIIPAYRPAEPVAEPCVGACDCAYGRVVLGPDAKPWSYRPTCFFCHGHRCAACRSAGTERGKCVAGSAG